MKSGELRKVVVALCEAFRQHVNDAMIGAYGVGLRGLTDEELKRATAIALQRCKFMPSPAELREFVSGNDESRAVRAWSDVQRAMPLGSYRHVSFDDGLINAVIRTLGGWPAMFERCADADGEKWYRLEFERVYKSFAAGNVDGEACRPLPGLSAKSVLDGKIVEPVPKRIGCDPERRVIVQQSQSPKLSGSSNAPLVVLKTP